MSKRATRTVGGTRFGEQLPGHRVWLQRGSPCSVCSVARRLGRQARAEHIAVLIWSDRNPRALCSKVAPGPTSVEFCEVWSTGLLHHSQEELDDDKAGDDKEDVDSDIAATETGNAGVEENDDPNRNCP